MACRWYAPCCIHGAQLVHISRPVIKHKHYPMEAKRHMNCLLEMPLSLVADNAVRRLDIGCNKQHRRVPLFSLSQGANGHVSTIWHHCTLLNLCFYRPFQCCARVAALSKFQSHFHMETLLLWFIIPESCTRLENTFSLNYIYCCIIRSRCYFKMCGACRNQLLD